MSKSKWLILGFVLLLIGVLTIGLIFGTASVKTVTVTGEKAENAISGSGIVTMELKFINAEHDGYALYSVKEGKLIKKYTPIATVYSGEINDEMAEKLKLMNDRMTLNKNAQSYKDEVFNDIASVNKEINTCFSQLMNETANGDYSNVYEQKNRIIAYHEKSLEMSGKQVPAKDEGNEAARIAELESQLSVSKNTYTSPMDGMFSPRIKNFDTLITPSLAMTLTPSSYETIASTDVKEINEVRNGEPFAKIINNFEWYLVASVSEEKISELETGSVVELRVTSISDVSVDGKIMYISEPESGKKVVVVKSTKYIEGIYNADKVQFDIIKKSYKGLRIPVSAIVKKGEKEGVISIKEGIYKFVEINIIFRDNNYVIIEDVSSEHTSISSNIVLYDVVVLNPDNVKEGSIAGG